MKVLGVIVAILFVMIIFYFTATPAGVATWNTWWHGVQQADNLTNYETRKKVEDTCRSMIASYESDKLTYLQYKDSDSKEKQSWAEQAKMRANKTASTYNNYILNNSYVWKGNVPADIYMKLEIID